MENAGAGRRFTGRTGNARLRKRFTTVSTGGSAVRAPRLVDARFRGYVLTSMGGDPLINARIGKVKLLRKLGAGAMGVVYQGWHESFACEVAVKFLTSSTGNSRERFLREGRAAARIDHEHVIRVLDAGEFDGRAYLVLEFVNGRSLGDLLDAQEAGDRGKPPAGRPPGSLPDHGVVAHLGAQLARGLAAIHERGIVHRDIKPDNVLVSREGKAKIADLGLAKQVSDPDLLRLTATGMVVGTPLYVSPEGIRDPKNISGASDIYSLGATLYHLLTGTPPFNAKTAYEVMRGHLEEKVRPIRELRPDVPPHLAQLVERCLAKAPEKRPGPLAIALELESGRGRTGRRALLVFTAVIAAALTVTLGSGWLLLRGRQADAGVPAATATLTLQADRAPLVARIDGGAWQAVNGPLPLAPGSRRIEVRVDQDGPRLTWGGDVTIAPGAAASAPITLRPATIPVVRVPAPGSAGLVFRDGQLYGSEALVSFANPGRFHLGRWDGSRWTSQVVTIGDDGAVEAATPGTAEHPEGPAWFRFRDAQFRACPPHHVVSWLEADQLRERRKLLVGPRWLEQGLHPEQPISELTPILVVPLADLIEERGLGRLPTGGEARALSAVLQAPLWSREQLQVEAVGGRPGAALLVLVPR